MNILPNPTSRNRGSRRYKFLRRLLTVKQMDFELAIWEMLNLCVAPHKVFRNVKYHKQTKNQWARDDPAFLVILAVCLCVTSLGFSLYFWFPWYKTLTFTLWVILVDCVGLGLLISTATWFIANRYLRQSTPHSVPEEVEWAYAFDIHCNAFFPLVLILHVIQLVLMPVITLNNFISVVVANTLYLAAVCYYVYITFLGFTALPFLGNTTTFFYPAAFFILFYFATLLMKWNLSVSVLRMYGITI